MSMSSSSSSNLASSTGNSPEPRDLALAANTLAIVQAQVSKVPRLCSGGSFTLQMIADDINELNSNEHGGLFVQKDLLCHANAQFWTWLYKIGWKRSTPDDSNRCRGSAIGSFAVQPKRNHQVIPVAPPQYSIPQGSNQAKALTFIATLRDDILEQSGHSRMDVVADLSGFFPGAQSIERELEKMLQYADF